MRVLLLGKYPPVQGGIAAKTFWLLRRLCEQGIAFEVITIASSPLYRSDSPGPLPANLALHVLRADADEVPWFIPESDLWGERLVSAALECCKKCVPDLVEANFLVPFGLAAFTVARMIRRPLLLRHAGSDLLKIGRWRPVEEALRSLLRAADRVVTNSSARSLLPPDARAVVLPRYVPDPAYFHPDDACRPSTGRAVPKTLLVPGKLNYYWRLKALDTLFAALEMAKDWNVLLVGDGRGRPAVEREIRARNLSERVTWSPFVSPSEAPDLFARAAAVWAVKRPGGVADFSNLIWESAAAGRSCLVEVSEMRRSDLDGLIPEEVVLGVNPDDPAGVAAALRDAENHETLLTGFPWTELHEEYIARNRALYESFL